MACFQSTSITGSFHPGRSQNGFPNSGSLFYNPYACNIPYSGGSVGALVYTYNGASWTNLTPYPYYDGSAKQTQGVGLGSFNFGFDEGSNYNMTVKLDSGGMNGVYSLCACAPHSRYQRGAAGKGFGSCMIVFGGRISPTNAQTGTTYEFNHSLDTWGGEGTKTNPLTLSGGAGCNTSALSIGGTGTGGPFTCTEEYNGSSWSNGGSMNIAMNPPFSTWGFQSNAVRAGGWFSSVSTGGNCTEEYNGSTNVWTNGPSLNTGRRCNSGGGSGTSNGMVWAGRSSALGTVIDLCTEVYDGISYSNCIRPNWSGTDKITGGNNNASQVSFGGNFPGSKYTEKWQCSGGACCFIASDDCLFGVYRPDY